MWPVPLLIGICLAPESPWWLVRKGRIEQAKKSLLRLTSLNKETNFDADDTIAMMVHTTALEEKVNFASSMKVILLISSTRSQKAQVIWIASKVLTCDEPR